MMKKIMYRWHRISALIIAIPVLLWSISGIMHPLMTNVKPRLAQQWIQPQVIHPEKMKWSLREALLNQNILEFKHSRVVSIHHQYFYQIAVHGNPELIYISASNGALLKGGDALYARYLAKQLLDGKKDSRPAERQLASLSDKPLCLPVGTPMSKDEEDCCQMATYSVLSNQEGTPIHRATLVTDFDDEYLSINRLLPVYKVETKRADGIRLYIDTQQDRLGFATDNRRRAFDLFFRWFHTMSWMDGLGNGKLWIEILLMALTMFSAIMGLYIFFNTKNKKRGNSSVARWRWNHRYSSVVASLFTLAFSFSGAYHAWAKLSPDTRQAFAWEPVLKTENILGDFSSVQVRVPDEPLVQMSPVVLNNVYYWQVYTQTRPGMQSIPVKAAGRPSMGMERRMPKVYYIHMQEQSILPEGDQQYAAMLATWFGKSQRNQITSILPITKFEGEYGFVNKRLPVWKVSFPQHHQERYYVETSTGKLSVRLDNTDLPEGYSFSFLHKHHFMDVVGGKLARDLSTLFWGMMQMAMVAVGLTFYFKQRSRKKNPTYQA